MLKLLLVAAVVFPLLQAARFAEPADQAANVRISTDYRADKAACALLAASARDLCYEQAGARKKVARAELEYGNGGNARDRHKVLEARAEAAYSGSRDMCSGINRDVKDFCLEQARAVEAKALADAGQATPAASPRRPDGARVQRAVVDTHKPAAASFKAVAL
jgi:hypothetical protein